MKVVDEIFELESSRLLLLAKAGPLDLDALKRLEILTRSLKNYSGQAPKDTSHDLGDLPLEELLRLSAMSLSDESEPT